MHSLCTAGLSANLCLRPPCCRSLRPAHLSHFFSTRRATETKTHQKQRQTRPLHNEVPTRAKVPLRPGVCGRTWKSPKTWLLATGTMQASLTMCSPEAAPVRRLVVQRFFSSASEGFIVQRFFPLASEGFIVQRFFPLASEGFTDVCALATTTAFLTQEFSGKVVCHFCISLFSSNAVHEDSCLSLAIFTVAERRSLLSRVFHGC